MTETPAVERPHGSRDKYSHEKCRCTPCRKAFQAYKDMRDAAIAAGTWQPFMDAEPVREHLRELMAGGLSARATAELAGVAQGTLASLLYGHPSEGRAPSRGIDVETGRRILSVCPTPDDYPPRAWIDATGTKRRLQSLAVLGWPPSQIAPHVGVRPQEIQRIQHRDRVLASTARAVRDAHKLLWTRRPSTATRAERIAVTKTLAHAQKNGWVSSLAWEDIDNPADTSDLGEKTPRYVSLFENSEELMAQGYTFVQVAERLGVTKNHLEKARAYALRRREAA